jgi:hypothetical protein
MKSRIMPGGEVGWSDRTSSHRPSYLLEVRGDAVLRRPGFFVASRGNGFKSNYFDVETGEHYWISGPRRDGKDALYATYRASA